MGVVQKQGVSAAIISYAGAALGFVNKVVLFTNFLTLSQVGFFNALPSLALMFSQFAALGTPNATLRFFPFFRQKERKHNGFLFGFFLINLVGFGLFSLIFFLFQDQILDIWSVQTPILHEKYYLLFPFAFCYLMINFFEAYLRSLYKIAVMSLVREILLRLPASIGICLYALGYIDFDFFVDFYVALVILAAFVPVIYLIYLRQFFILPNFGRVWQRLYKRIFGYTLATFLSYGSSIVLSYLDLFMLTFYVKEERIGIFLVMSFISSVITIPYKALMRISGALVADHWKQKNMKEMQRIYQRTSLISMMAGVFIFLGIWINRQNLFSIMQGGDYSPGLPVLLILGLAKVFDMTAGLNGIILSTSRKYIFDTFFQLALIGIGIGTNLWLIPQYGIYGAAAATAISLVSINMARIIAVWILFKLQPFSRPMLLIILIGVLGYGVIEFIPQMPFLMDIPVRSLIFTLIFGGLMLRLEVSKDVNEYIERIAARLGVPTLLKPFLKRKK
ncbi:MAG: polysaccharide biosynthesis C-terminal domain-containing protein [Bacteroidia bacterium]|nr:polysaccharide biosynthesis C-terminal domain-containing protein [Bacteroidia bacterium]